MMGSRRDADAPHDASPDAADHLHNQATAPTRTAVSARGATVASLRGRRRSTKHVAGYKSELSPPSLRTTKPSQTDPADEPEAEIGFRPNRLMRVNSRTELAKLKDEGILS